MSVRYCLFFCLLFLVFPSFHAQEDLHGRVKQLEVQVQQLTEEVLQLREALRVQEKLTEKLGQTRQKNNPLLYDDLIDSFKQESKEDEWYAFYRQLIHSHVWLGGHLDFKVEGRESHSDKGILELSSISLQLKSAFHENISVESEIRFSEPDTATVSHAYLLFSCSSFLNFKAGVIRVPFGRYNSIYSPPSENLGSIPLVDEFLIPTIWSEPGVSIFGQIQALPPLAIHYEVMISNGLGENGFDKEKGNADARQKLNRDNNSDKQWAGRIGLVPSLGLDVLSMYLGFSGVIGRYDEDKRAEYRGGALDFFIRAGPFSLIGDHDQIEISGEYAHFFIERDARILTKFPNTTPRSQGYYLEADYIFFPENWRELKPFFGDKSEFGIGFRYEWLDMDTHSQGASILDDVTTYTLGFCFRPVEETAIRIEYSWIREMDTNGWSWNNRVLASIATYF